MSGGKSQVVPRLGRMTVGLYNSYDPVNFREAHRRILARAGPISLAFDANLATFGFPFPQDLSTPIEISDWIATTTSIGEDGSYLRELASNGRFQTFPYIGKGFPPQLGETVLTTCNAEDKKRRSVDDVCSMLLDGDSICLIFGTGPKGTPKEVSRIAQHHLDITNDGYSLETCTALGAVVAVLFHTLRRMSREGR
jgi:hypothetical protein